MLTRPPEDATPSPEPAGSVLSRLPRWIPRVLAGEFRLYAAAAILSLLAVTLMTRLWRAVWTVPFNYSIDALSSAGHFKTTLGTGWYEFQPDLGAPYGQHYHDYPFTDDLHPLMIKVFGLFSHSWPVVFNLYYVAGYPLAALAAVWFLRRCQLSSRLAVVLAVLFAVAPYHLWRNENHFFLGEYYALPLALGVVLAVGRGEPIWGRRRGSADGGSAEGTGTGTRGGFRSFAGLRRVTGLVGGRGVGTTVALILVVADGAYYGVFTGLLLAAAAALAFYGHRNRRRLFGAIAAGGVLAATFVALSLPDIVARRATGPNPGALVRYPRDSEVYALKLASLVLPAPGHPIPWLASLRTYYDTNYPLPSEQPALGLLAAIGFLLLLAVPLIRLFRRPPEPLGPAAAARAATVTVLAALTWVSFLTATTGGFGTLISFGTDSIRGWNRMSIVLMLFALAGLGLFVQDRVARRDRRDRARGRPPGGRRWLPVLATALLVFGVFDQSSSVGVPDYAATARTFQADQQFFQAIQADLPAGAMVFQTPYIAWPEAGQVLYGAVENDQLIPFLHTQTVRWSGGGIKGRPQIDWTRTVSDEPVEQMTHDLAVLGFGGVLLDRAATPDNGTSRQDDLTRVLGAPTHDQQDGRFVYFSLAPVVARVEVSMTPAARAAAARAIDHIPD